MNAILSALLNSWSFDPWLFWGLTLTAAVYVRGWLALDRRDRQRWPVQYLAAFLSGLLVLYLALASPIEAFSSLLQQAHMLQHMLLMMVAPPLLWLGAPKCPLLQGLPRPLRVQVAIPVSRSPLLRDCFSRLTHPAAAVTLFVAVTWIWHAPPAYELVLRSGAWHYVQHGCFFASGLLLWYPIIRPYPSHPRWSLWMLAPLLLVAEVQNTMLSAIFTFSRRVVYPYYLTVPRIGGLSALQDQSTAGVLMWLIGSFAFLPPLVSIGIRLLAGNLATGRVANGADRQLLATQPNNRELIDAKFKASLLPILQPDSAHRGRSSRNQFNLLRVPLVGRFLKWRHARLAMQLPFLALAGVMIVDGLRGPQVGAMNLAGVLPWIHWRGLLVLTLLVAGNFFCAACPFVAPRSLARRWLPRGRSWPLWLRNKWLAIGLLVTFLWAYEAFSLWNSPWWTAWLAIGYFTICFVIDGIFEGAAFCKYVCPIGQFNFVQSLVSPLEVKVVNRDVCLDCHTKDCIRGRDGIPGCELQLFQPRKVGNMDCTFCLDCIHACPHENVGILARMPGPDLISEGSRSGVGQFQKRADLAALVIVLVFGAFANAAGMVGPVVSLGDRITAMAGLTSPLPVTTTFYVLSLLVIPAVAIFSVALVSRNLGRLDRGPLDVAIRFSYALVPIGLGMWLAHYSFHLLTSCDTIVPTAARFAGDLGITLLGDPQWVASCCRPATEAPLRLELVFLELGLLLSLYTAHRIARSQTTSRRDEVLSFAPWAVLTLALFALGVWIILQPMQMRGAL